MHHVHTVQILDRQRHLREDRQRVVLLEGPLGLFVKNGRTVSTEPEAWARDRRLGLPRRGELVCFMKRGCHFEPARGQQVLEELAARQALLSVESAAAPM